MILPISVKKGKGIIELQEAILLQSEMLELTAQFDRKATGMVLETKFDKFNGLLSTLLVQNGELRTGDAVVLINQNMHFKVQSVMNSSNKRVKIAFPSTPVLVKGPSIAPKPGDTFIVVKNEKEAKQILYYQKLVRQQIIAKPQN